MEWNKQFGEYILNLTSISHSHKNYEHYFYARPFGYLDPFKSKVVEMGWR
jgi:hypothetical protein